MNIIVFSLRMDLRAICWIHVNHYKHIISNWILFILNYSHNQLWGYYYKLLFLKSAENFYIYHYNCSTEN